jgi:coenzyme F420-dependent glucose-6-phosphate dehydrogenase
MAMICYHASHEQFAPSRLLRLAIAAERAGFSGLQSSDHFHPWSSSQGQSGFSFSWIAAALQATALPCSVVTAPGQRYHPAVTAQAIATLEEMFPGRFSAALGSGEALNESITGQQWPDKQTRNKRLLESARVIDRLLQGERVTFNGLISVRNARLYTLPAKKPLLLGAAVSEETAHWLGSWAEGLLTTADKDHTEVAKKIKAFEDGGGKGRPIYLHYSFSYARKRKDAIDELWDQWKVHTATAGSWSDIGSVEEFDHAAKNTTPEEVLESTAVFTDMVALGDSIRSLEALGAQRIILHNLNRQQEEFIADFEESGISAKNDRHIRSMKT